MVYVLAADSFLQLPFFPDGGKIGRTAEWRLVVEVEG